jgi:hypothetical protein
MLAAYDAKRGLDYDPRDVEEPDYPRTRKAAPPYETEEASGLDDAAGICDQFMGLANKAGLNPDQISKLEEIVEAVLARHPGGEDADPEEQPSIEGPLTAGDPDPHLRASPAIAAPNTRWIR